LLPPAGAGHPPEESFEPEVGGLQQLPESASGLVPILHGTLQPRDVPLEPVDVAVGAPESQRATLTFRRVPVKNMNIYVKAL
jgi:hypothetical protein